MKLITVKWLEEKNACGEAVRKYTSWLNGGKPLVECIEKLERADWLLWLLWHYGVMTHSQLVKLACLCVRQTLHIYEKRYPDDMRPRRAIEAAEAWSDDPTDKNKVLVATAARAAVYAVVHADNAAAAYAADAAVYVAYAVIHAAVIDAATYAGYAIIYAADEEKKLHAKMCAGIVEKLREWQTMSI